MKNLFILLLITVCFSAQAQKLRYTDKRNHWVARGFGGGDVYCPYTRWVSFGSDTVINALSYVRVINIWGADPDPLCSYGGIDSTHNFIREDTAEGKVYEFSPIPFIPGSDTTEHVLFDYNLHLGDTINNFGTRDSVKYLDSTIIDGVYHKVFGIGRSSGDPYSYIEGFGSVNSPVYPLNYCFEHEERVVCFYQDSNYITVQTRYPPCFGSFDSINTISGCASLAVHDVNKFIPAVTIAPNPATDEIKISVGHSVYKTLLFSIYNMQGRVVCTSKLSVVDKDAMINCSSWPEGIYLVVVQTDDSILKKEKIVIQR